MFGNERRRAEREITRLEEERRDIIDSPDPSEQDIAIMRRVISSEEAEARVSAKIADYLIEQPDARVEIDRPAIAASLSAAYSRKEIRPPLYLIESVETLGIAAQLVVDYAFGSPAGEELHLSRLRALLGDAAINS